MRMKAVAFGLALALLGIWGSPAFGQGNPNSKLSGRVTSGNDALPGVKVTVSSPNLQGTKSATTSNSGDYLFPSLPPGDYTVTFEREGMATEKQELQLAAAQTSTLDTEMAAAAVTEEIVVTGNLESISETTQVATTYTKHLIDELPAGRTINQIVALSPGVQPNGPTKDTTTGLGNITISGAPTYENLFLVNGVVLNENLRGQAFELYIEDAVQETTTATAGVSAEYGRFSGGVVNIITKSGGNSFSGSLRTTLNNQTWEEKRPDPNHPGQFAPQTDKTIPTYEATLGGAILRDRLWFFAAGRSLDRDTTQVTTLTSVPFTNERKQQRYEGKLTATITPQHSLLGSYLKIDDKENGNFFPPILDTASLVNRETPQKAWSINYTGTFTDSLLLTGQYSERKFTFIGSGANSRDLIDGTLILATNLGSGRYHSATFCGVCEPEHRDNKNALVKASYFFSTPTLGSHDMVAGYDTFDDIRNANNHQSGSDYRIIGTSAIIQGNNIFPVFNNDGSTLIQFNPIPKLSQGTAFKTNSLYANDTWRISDRLTVNLGLRYDKNDGKDAEGKKVAKDSNLSPRLAATFDPSRDGKLVLHASYGKYVAALANSIGDSTSSAGAPQAFQWVYRGPAINVGGGPLLTQDEALRTVFQWFNDNGGPTGPLPLFAINIPGGNTKIKGSLDSPNVVEYSLGATTRLGTRGLARADVVHRDWSDFYNSHLDLTTGRVVAGNGPTDLALVENNNRLYSRTYDGLHTQFRVRANDRLDIGGTYTLSYTKGNFDGENQGSGPLIGGLGRYPEYRDLRWAAPKGDLAVDQRHRISLYGLFKVFSIGNQELTASVLQSYFSGHPYGAVGTASLLARANDLTSNYVNNPGYLNPPQTATYYFTARDAFTTPAIYRTDISLNYTFRIGKLDLFLHPEMVNVFNQQRVDSTAIDLFNTTVLTANNTSTLTRFNPFTETPVEGVNWRKGPNFGKPVSPQAYEQPRTYRFSVGLRF